MENKTLFLMFASILLIGVVSAEDIAYVLKNPQNPNPQFIEVMNELNYSYDLIDDSQVSTTNFADYKMILLKDENIAGVPVDRYPSLIVPSLNSNSNYYLAWSSLGLGHTQQDTQPLSADNANPTSRITKGIGPEFQIYTKARFNGLSIPAYYLNGKKYNTNQIVIVKDDPLKYVIATKLNPREVFFGITESDYWTTDSRKLFKNSIIWIIEGDEVNKAPVLKENIPIITWNTGETRQINLNNYFSDPNLDKLSYGVYATSKEANITLDIHENIVTFSSVLGWGGEDWIMFYATDGKFNTASNNVILKVRAEGYQPIVELLNPVNNSQITDRNIFFEFSAKDNLANLLKCDLYIDNLLISSKNVANSTTNNFTNSVGDGEHFWNVKCFNGMNRDFAPSNFIFSVNAPDAPILQNVGSKTVRENSTLIFIVSATDPDGDEVNLSVENLPNGATFVDNKNGSGLFSWTPNLEQAGIYNIVFRAEDTTGKIDKKTASINVMDLILPPTFEDADTCSVVDNNITVTISDPDDGDNFEIGEEIKIKSRIENDGNEDVKFEAKAYLYDLNEDKVIEENKKNIKVKEGNSEKTEFSLKIPDDVDTEDNFAVYIIAFENDDKFCNSNFVNIEIEKPDKKIAVKDFAVSPEEVRGNEKVSFEVEVKNIGSDDLEDVYVEIKNSGLGLDLKSEKFNLDEDDKETINLYFIVPKNASETTYEIEASVVYDGESDQETKELVVIGKRSVVSQPIAQPQGEVSNGNIIYLDNKKPISLTKKSGAINLGSKDIVVKEETPEIKVSLSGDEGEKSDGKIENVISGGSEMILLFFASLGVNAILVFGIVVVAILIVIVWMIKR